MTPLLRRRLPWLVAGLTLVLVGVGATLSVLAMVRLGNMRPLLSHQGLVPLITLAFAILGGLVAARHPNNAIGWLYLATAILYALNAVSVGYTAYWPLAPISWRFLSDGLAWLSRWIWIPAQTLPLIFALLFFPDGRLPSARWRPFAVLAGLSLVTASASVALHPGPIVLWNIPGGNPYGLPGTGDVLEPVLNVSAGMLAASALGTMLALALRWRRARGLAREQLQWVVYTTVALLVVGSVANILAPLVMSTAAVYEFGIVLSELVVLGLAVAVTVAILRYRLYDLNLVLNRTLVYGALTTVVLALYGLVVGGLGVLLQARGSLALSLLGVGLAAIAAQPIRERLQRAVNRLMYGDRDDPYAALSRLGQRLENTDTPQAVLDTLVEAVATALKLPYVGISLKQGEDFSLLVERGRAVGELTRLPLTYQGQAVGALLVSARSPGERLGTADQRLLDDLARQAGAAAHAVRLTLALQRSREQLVTAREEERLRLRRDLHDGLGPRLASLQLRLETASNRMAHDPAAQALLADLATAAAAAVADIRRLVYALRPATLDELGLVNALREAAAQYPAAGLKGVRITIEAPDELPALPAAVEVATYRITQEAITNVVRHARASQCVVRLALEEPGGWLRLEVQDDGRGMPERPTPGIGLDSMRERAEELGGHWTVEPGQPRGTRVSVQLPCRVFADGAAVQLERES